jgi:hypothetical protein
MGLSFGHTFECWLLVTKGQSVTVSSGEPIYNLIKRKSGLQGYACHFSRWEFLVARISRVDLDHCIAQKECLDCYLKDRTGAGPKLQRRSKLLVPCCLPHFNAHKRKTSQANAQKYARRSKAKREVRQCVSPGCHHKLIPQELLPPWWKPEKTCGMHVAFKAFRVNRNAIVKFVIEHCLSPGLGDGMVAQSIIYHSKEAYILFGLSKSNLHLTRGFSASDLLKRYEQFRGRKSRTF